jgi:hypothetical protein
MSTPNKRIIKRQSHVSQRSTVERDSWRYRVIWLIAHFRRINQPSFLFTSR